MSLDLHLYKQLKVGDIILLHPSAYAYNSAAGYGLGHGDPKDPLIGGSPAYRLPNEPYLVVHLRNTLMALSTGSGIAWVSISYVQEIL